MEEEIERHRKRKKDSHRMSGERGWKGVRERGEKEIEGLEIIYLYMSKKFNKQYQ